jgi:hypothetical protein
MTIGACPYCDEALRDGEPVIYGASQGFHRECFIRMIAGSAAHQLGECSCCGGNREDPPGVSRREAAKLAYETFYFQKCQQEER